MLLQQDLHTHTHIAFLSKKGPVQGNMLHTHVQVHVYAVAIGVYKQLALYSHLLVWTAVRGTVGARRFTLHDSRPCKHPSALSPQALSQSINVFAIFCVFPDIGLIGFSVSLTGSFK